MRADLGVCGVEVTGLEPEISTMRMKIGRYPTIGGGT
jgi:hypothetical protein